MHSRIFQLTKNTEKIKENDLLTEYKIWEDHDWFLIDIADYVSDISEKEKEENIKWFIDSMKEKCNKFLKIDNEQKSITFLPGFKNEYFTEQFEYFKQQANKITLDEFSEKCPMKLSAIKHTIEDKFGFYIFNEYGELITLDSFVRSLSNSDQETYYFGSVLDYHF